MKFVLKVFCVHVGFLMAISILATPHWVRPHHMVSGEASLLVSDAASTTRRLSGPMDVTVAQSGRYLTRNGAPFYWLADTGWDLFYQLDEADTRRYARARADQSFNAVLVILVDGYPARVTQSGAQPFALDPHGRLDITRPQASFFDLARRQIEILKDAGLTPVILAAWGTNVAEGRIDTANAFDFGSYVSSQFSGASIVWLLGGDSNPSVQEVAVWRLVAQGLRASCSGCSLVSYHPQSGSSARWFGPDVVDFHSIQGGHARLRPKAKSVSGSMRQEYAETLLPLIDLEPGYEWVPDRLESRHPRGSYVAADDRLGALDIRMRAYAQYLSGGFGFTYGHWDVAKFWRPGDPERWIPEIPWNQAMDAPGATQLQHFQKLRMWLGTPSLKPASELLGKTVYQDDYHQNLAACRGQGDRRTNVCAVYSPAGDPIDVRSSAMPQTGQPFWFDPASGRTAEAQAVVKSGFHRFTPVHRTAPDTRLKHGQEDRSSLEEETSPDAVLVIGCRSRVLC